MKTIGIILGALIGVILLFGFGYRSLSSHIHDRQDCERFVIDNIEVRTGVDIPPVETSTCNLVDHVKTASFQLKRPLDIDHYINRNKFVLTDNGFVNAGSRPESNWRITLDTQRLVLDVHLEYLDR